MSNLEISESTALWVEVQKRILDLSQSYSRAAAHSFGSDQDHQFDEVFMPLLQPLQDLVERHLTQSIVENLGDLKNQGKVI